MFEGFGKLASRVLETRFLYKTQVSKTRFVLDDLASNMSHRS